MALYRIALCICLLVKLHWPHLHSLLETLGFWPFRIVPAYILRVHWRRLAENHTIQSTVWLKRKEWGNQSRTKKHLQSVVKLCNLKVIPWRSLHLCTFPSISPALRPAPSTCFATIISNWPSFWGTSLAPFVWATTARPIGSSSHIESLKPSRI